MMQYLEGMFPGDFDENCRSAMQMAYELEQRGDLEGVGFYFYREQAGDINMQDGRIFAVRLANFLRSCITMDPHAPLPLCLKAEKRWLKCVTVEPSEKGDCWVTYIRFPEPSRFKQNPPTTWPAPPKW